MARQPTFGMATLARPATRFAATFGSVAEEIARHAGQIGILIARVAAATVAGRVPLRDVVNQIYWMGVQSLPIVIVTAFLSGVVTSQQGGYQFTGAVPIYVLGAVVVNSIVLELAPVLTAIVLIGRVGARITAEIGTMMVSEQIDALHSLSRDPVRILAAPKVIAGLIAVPLLVCVAIGVGILSGMVASQLAIGLGPESFMYGARLYWHDYNLFYSLMKAVTFGFLIPVISIHMGFRTRGGAEGVGRSTTASVMFMTLAVLIADAMFPPLLLE